MALVVGIDRYDGVRWSALQCCANDAFSVANILERDPYDFEVTLLTDDEASKRSIYQAIFDLQAKKPDTLIFYFAGHGAVTPLGSFLVTADSEEYNEGIELPKLAQVLARRGDSANVVAFLDCCHGGAAYLRQLDTSVSILDTATVSKEFAGLSESRAVLAACGASEMADESLNLGHGVFTNYLLQGLEGAAADHEGNISVLSLQMYINRPFAQMDDDVPKPVFRGDMRGSLVLASGLPPRLGPPLDKDIADQIVAEATNHLDRYSRLINYYDPSSWRTEGFQEAYRVLTPIAAWFDRQVKQNPSLMKRQDFVQQYDALVSRRQALGTIEAGTRIEEGVIVESIGSGGYGEVWKVEDEHSNVQAFKIYHPHELRDPEKRDRFQTGYEAMRQMSNAKIVKVARFSECPLGFLMEYISGPNLRELGPGTFMDSPELLRLLIDIVETIEYAHVKEVIHRDVKPENIIVSTTPDGKYEPHLTDFDLAWYSTANQKNTKSALGVVYYAAPEQHIAYNPRAAKGKRPTLDVFSFGQLMYFVLTSTDPDPVQLTKNAQGLAASARRWGSGEAVAQLRDLYLSCTEWDPEKRIQDFQTIGQLLRAIVASLTYSSQDVRLSARTYMQELLFQLTGEPSRLDNDSAEFVSSSGNWRVTLSFVTRDARRGVSTTIVAHFVPNEHYGLPGLTVERFNNVLRKSVDAVLSSRDNARRRSTRRDSNDVFVDIDKVSMTLGSVAKTANILTKVLSALEK
jgi:serine/threonine protein kinase